MLDFLERLDLFERVKSLHARDVTAAIICALIVSRLLSRFRRRGYRLPPGPKPLPLIGNYLDLPKDHDWIHWAKHKDSYGPISSVTVFGQTFIILNDVQVTVDLLQKRSNIYCNRPTLTFGGKMCGWANATHFLQYEDLCKAHRRSELQLLGSQKALEPYQDLIYTQLHTFLHLIHRTPTKLADHIKFYSGSIIIKMLYGYEATTKFDDPLVKLAKDTMGEFSDATVAGRWTVDLLPILQYVPSWFPGAKFRKTAQRYNRSFLEFVSRPFSFVKQEIASGSAVKSYTADLLEAKGTNAEQEFFALASAASLYMGGTATMSSGIHTFFLAIMLFPEVQRKAQAEIDAVTGSLRLPTLEDRPNLPYINAVVKESLRWNTAVPMGIPHVPTQDDVYEEFFVPKGAIILPNVWLFTHDPENYKNPSEFRPERFLQAGDVTPERDPGDLVFGFGRRVCPGKQLADIELFLAIATSLAVFDIKRPTDVNGQVIEEEYGFSPTGLLNYPNEFACSITPRSKEATALLDGFEEETRNDSGHAEKFLRLP